MIGREITTSPCRARRIGAILATIVLVALMGCKEELAYTSREAHGDVEGTLVMATIRSDEELMDARVYYVQHSVKTVADTEATSGRVPLITQRFEVYSGNVGREPLPLAFAVPEKISVQPKGTWSAHLVADCIIVEYSESRVYGTITAFNEELSTTLRDTKWDETCAPAPPNGVLKVKVAAEKIALQRSLAHDSSISAVWKDWSTAERESYWTHGQIVVLKRPKDATDRAMLTQELCLGNMTLEQDPYMACVSNDVFVQQSEITIVDRNLNGSIAFMRGQLKRVAIDTPFYWHPAKWEVVSHSTDVDAVTGIEYSATFLVGDTPVEARVENDHLEVKVTHLTEQIEVRARRNTPALAQFNPRIERTRDNNLTLTVEKPRIQLRHAHDTSDCGRAILDDKIDDVRRQIWEFALAHDQWTGSEGPEVSLDVEYAAPNAQGRVHLLEEAGHAFEVDARFVDWNMFELKLPNVAEAGRWILQGASEKRPTATVQLDRTNRAPACEFKTIMGPRRSEGLITLRALPAQGSPLEGFVSARVNVDPKELQGQAKVTNTDNGEYWIEVSDKDLEWASLKLTPDAIKHFAPSMTVRTIDRDVHTVRADATSGGQGGSFRLANVDAVGESLVKLRELTTRAEFQKLTGILELEDGVKRCAALRELFGFPDGSAGEMVPVYTGGKPHGLRYEDETPPRAHVDEIDINFTRVVVDPNRTLRNEVGEEFSHAVACSPPRTTDHTVALVFLRKNHKTETSSDFRQRWNRFAPAFAQKLRHLNFTAVQIVYPERAGQLQQRYIFRLGAPTILQIDGDASSYLGKLRLAGMTGLAQDGEKEAGLEDVREALRQYRVAVGQRRIVAFVPPQTAPDCASEISGMCRDGDILWWEGGLDQLRIEELASW